MCTSCTSSSKYPKQKSTTCTSCPEGCDGCQLVNGKVSCLKCKDGYHRESEGLHLECDENLAWYWWALIILGILVVLGVIGFLLASGGKKKNKNMYGNGQFNEF
jgi:hypothetical protein